MKNLIGIVACGGNSERMGQDKGLINYHGIAQRYYVYEQLQKICKKVYLSVNLKQSTTISASYHFIVDEERYSEIGPMAALLSVHHRHPDSSFLFIGCDYPNLTLSDLNKLVSERNELMAATCYYNASTAMLEPLLAIYEKTCFPLLAECVASKKLSLRHFLIQSNVKSVLMEKEENMVSVDTLIQRKNLKLK